ncbi:L-2-hydroxyglutarate dehydrogenase, mitochondrial-like [Salvia divinorum]|uniref:L-2-hydroxyglutarate dehydrogenase, mitochondrial-like n=1 Tax=Salvia divinorum TaxID=28513 RepID=A0ABD1G0P3_SALDI
MWMEKVKQRFTSQNLHISSESRRFEDDGRARSYACRARPILHKALLLPVSGLIDSHSLLLSLLRLGEAESHGAIPRPIGWSLGRKLSTHQAARISSSSQFILMT